MTTMPTPDFEKIKTNRSIAIISKTLGEVSGQIQISNKKLEELTQEIKKKSQAELLVEVPEVEIEVDPEDFRGLAGYTPLRGKDYWNAEDVRAIHKYIDEHIPEAIPGEKGKDADEEKIYGRLLKRIPKAETIEYKKLYREVGRVSKLLLPSETDIAKMVREQVAKGLLKAPQKRVIVNTIREVLIKEKATAQLDFEAIARGLEGLPRDKKMTYKAIRDFLGLVGGGGSSGGGSTTTTTVSAVSVEAVALSGIAANTYSNGVGGFGATLTANANGVLNVDGINITTLGQRVLLTGEGTASHNGVYILTVVGTGSVKWVLTRADDSDSDAEIRGAIYYVRQGGNNARKIYANTNTSAITVGTTSITYGNPVTIPAGSTGQLQYNLSGILTGLSGSVVSGSNLTLGGSLTLTGILDLNNNAINNVTGLGMASGAGISNVNYINFDGNGGGISNMGDTFMLTGAVLDMGGGVIQNIGSFNNSSGTFSVDASGNVYISGIWQFNGGGSNLLIFADDPTEWLYATWGMGLTGDATHPVWIGDNASGTSVTGAFASGASFLVGINAASMGGTNWGNGDTYLAKALSLGYTSPRSMTQGNLEMYGFVSTYKDIATAGWGFPTIYSSARSITQHGAATFTSYTVGSADSSFLISVNINVTTATAHNFSVICTYTDETNTARTLTIPVSTLAGTFITAITNITGAGPYESSVLRIRCKASTAIQLTTTGTFTTVTYNAEGSIMQIA